MKKKILVLLILPLLTACGSVLPKGEPAPRLYTLNAPQITHAAEPVLNKNLQVLMPQASPGLESERIALRTNSNKIDYYADSKWAAAPPAMLQTLLVESFDSSGGLQSVGNDLVAMKSDLSLLIEIHDFQGEYTNGAPHAHVRLVAKLINGDTHSILSAASYDASQPAKGNDLDSIVAAFDGATQRALAKIVQDSIQKIKLLPNSNISP